MIEKRLNADALNATEPLLFVPVPLHETDFSDGFASEVVSRYPLVGDVVKSHGGLGALEVLIIDELELEQRWMPAYSLALCGLHRREKRGWGMAPTLIQHGFDSIANSHGAHVQIATAGIPGTGFSGLVGDAKPKDIEEVMRRHSLRVTVYDKSLSGDREPRNLSVPLSDDSVELTLPSLR